MLGESKRQLRTCLNGAYPKERKSLFKTINVLVIMQEILNIV